MNSQNYPNSNNCVRRLKELISHYEKVYLNFTKIHDEQDLVLSTPIYEYFNQKLLSHENSVKDFYDIENRLNKLRVYKEEEKIIAFEVIQYKTLVKHDNGIFSSYLVILAFRNKIKIYDLYGNLIAEKKIEFEINELRCFHTQEGNFLITDYKKKFHNIVKLLNSKFSNYHFLTSLAY
jgi:hypothetical protein